MVVHMEDKRRLSTAAKRCSTIDPPRGVHEKRPYFLSTTAGVCHEADRRLARTSSSITPRGPKGRLLPRPRDLPPCRPARGEPQKTPSRLERQGTKKIRTPHPKVRHTNNAGRGENPIALDGVFLPVMTWVPTRRV